MNFILTDVLVSISCITFNHENYIADALDSFINQKTDFLFEVLVHDDASEDDTPQIIQRYQEKYPNIIKPILQKENQYSKGIRRIDHRYILPRAKGKYIAICEGDDYWTNPYKLQKQVDYMENNPKCGICFHSASKVDINRNIKEIVRPYKNNTIVPVADLILGGGGFMATNSIVYKKELFLNPPKLYFTSPVGDYPLQMLLSTKNYGYYMDQDMSSYRIGVSGSWSDRMKKDTEENVENRVNHINEINIMLDNFNKYTKCKYNNAIEQKKRENKLEVLILRKELRISNLNENADIISSFSLGRKVKIYTQAIFPKSYSFFRNIWRSLKK